MAKKAPKKAWWVEVDNSKDELGLDDDAWTDARWRAGAEHDVFRQCSIGWHLECSAWNSAECSCPCHVIIGKAISEARSKGKIP
jgi:hypothetical protein